MMAVKKSWRQEFEGYTTKPILLRLFSVGLFGILSLVIVLLLTKDPEAFRKLELKYYIIVFFTYNALSESQIVLDRLLEHIFPIPYKLRLRLGLQSLIGVILLLAFMNIVLSIFPKPEFENEKAKVYGYIAVLIGLIFVSGLTNDLTISRLIEKWNISTRQLDIIKQEKLLMDYNSLQDKLNPHFLFNNLSVLRGLIYKDVDLASKFIEDFADVYRYVLQSSNKQLVRLSEELEFLAAYLDMHKARIKEGLKVDYKIADDDRNKEIAPLTLQLLFENAIKHNITAIETPLQISIESNGESIWVSNTINLKERTYSTKTGLSNLVGRYQFLSDKTLVIENDGVHFTVKLPLI